MFNPYRQRQTLPPASGAEELVIPSHVGTLAIGEHTLSREEQFIGLRPVRQMVMDSIADRLSETGTVNPEEVEVFMMFNKATGERWSKGPMVDLYNRPGKLLPDERSFRTVDPQGNELYSKVLKMGTSSLIYHGSMIHNGLTAAGIQLNLGAEDIESLATDTAKLKDMVKQRGYSIETKPPHDAYFLENPKISPQDFQALRIYAPAGINAMKLVYRLMQDHRADPQFIKLWVPYLEEGTQNFRADTPIFEVTNFQQLQAVLKGLVEIQASDEPLINQSQVITGLEPEGLPGVYIGQTGRSSLNGRMSQFFDLAIRDAILANNLSTGKKVTDEWLNSVAQDARSRALASAEKHGINPINHAFLAGEPVEQILQVINEAANSI